MALPASVSGNGGGRAFPRLLKAWREKRRLSQLDLALASDVSQRHISFLESGRANPSREMVLQLSEALSVPLRDRNHWLTAAGFAALYKTRSLDDPEMAQVMSAIRMMLSKHEPYPAVAIDREWNVRLSNRPFDRMAEMLGNRNGLWRGTGSSDEERNLLRLFFHPEGIRPLVTNWSTIAPALWRRARREAEAAGGEPVQRLMADLRPLVDGVSSWESMEATAGGLVPVLPMQLEKDGLRLSLFTVISTFGTAQDVTADELRIELLFPADRESEELFALMARTEAIVS